jgi:hypothetical protein
MRELACSKNEAVRLRSCAQTFICGRKAFARSFSRRGLAPGKETVHREKKRLSSLRRLLKYKYPRGRNLRAEEHQFGRRGSIGLLLSLGSDISACAKDEDERDTEEEEEDAEFIAECSISSAL